MRDPASEATLKSLPGGGVVGTGSVKPGHPDRVDHDQNSIQPWETDRPDRSGARQWLVPAVAGTAAGLAAAALYNRKQAQEAERRYPPVGRFLDVDGVRLHYMERGQGESLVLIHGNGTMIQDFTVSGLVDRLADRYRVIVIDRPGYGYSARPRHLWTPRAHARLFRNALTQLRVERALVYGHSWGTLVAVALTLEAPSLVRGLVLGSGYYYPTLRADTFLLSPPAIPLVGDIMRHTVSPLVARAILPGMIKHMFQPAPVPERFEREFPKALMLRPLQLRASAEDAALMTPSVMDLEQHYRDLAVPVTLITGADDKVSDVDRQSARLHRELPHSAFIALPGLGHMIHHLAPDAVADAIDGTAQRSSRMWAF
ncbi:alpha/beta fold hydrolase [Microvirga makkahensis]|uniref:Alpha/beta fold hydrolase n=1 Tax=Microvirga makkahensis TaxID=1128670 RepID=A0A7X3MS51_9HYPH|nr:alpha/beta hydrolase [Microvirga makkahensis]MXQ12202.1 alpha/beta fold hydrolase [Microvirga makkahensis]